MGKTKDKAINNGKNFILKFFSYVIGGSLLSAILLTRLEKKDYEKDWMTSPSYYGLTSNYNKMKGGRRKQRGGRPIEKGMGENTMSREKHAGANLKNNDFPYSLDHHENNNIMQYLGNFFKKDWFTYRNMIKTWINWNILEYLTIDPVDSVENRNMWLPWKSITYKNILKMSALIFYFSNVLPIIASVIAVGTTLWAIFTNPFLETYKKNKYDEGSTYKYWLLMFFGIFLGMFSCGWGLWMSSIIIQIVMFLFYIFLSPLQYYKTFFKHTKNLFNFRKSDNDESKAHGIVNLLIFSILFILIGLGSNDWFTYNPLVMGILIFVELFLLLLYFYYR